jgi:hypothetical protein
LFNTDNSIGSKIDAVTKTIEDKALDNKRDVAEG